MRRGKVKTKTIDSVFFTIQAGELPPATGHAAAVDQLFFTGKADGASQNTQARIRRPSAQETMVLMHRSFLLSFTVILSTREEIYTIPALRNQLGDRSEELYIDKP